MELDFDIDARQADILQRGIVERLQRATLTAEAPNLAQKLETAAAQPAQRPGDQPTQG
jgi:hypothetical protein